MTNGRYEYILINIEYKPTIVLLKTKVNTNG